MHSAFVKFAASNLTRNAARIQTCLAKLTEDQVWLRTGENSNAAGNIVLHLCGNVRQWIGHGVAGKPDIRVRDAEFATRGGRSIQDLSDFLGQTAHEHAAIIQALTSQDLATLVDIQNYRGISKLEAVFHVSAHFAEHTGQIILLTKAYTGEDLGFYRHLNDPQHNETTP